MHSRESVHVAMTGVFRPVSRGEQTPASDIDTAGLSSPGR
jgi:predicted nucleotidyltransferase